MIESVKMSDFGRIWKPPVSQLTGRLNQLKETLRDQDPSLVAARSGVSRLTAGSGRVELHIPFWDDVCILPFPELTVCNRRGEPLSDFQQALLLYYLVTADGALLTGRWLSFADLPDGRMYNAAFQVTAAMRLRKNSAWIWKRSSQLARRRAGDSLKWVPHLLFFKPCRAYR